MASNVVNLNRFRKRKQREAEAKQAEINRVRHVRWQFLESLCGAPRATSDITRDRAPLRIWPNTASPCSTSRLCSTNGCSSAEESGPRSA